MYCRWCSIQIYIDDTIVRGTQMASSFLDPLRHVFVYLLCTINVAWRLIACTALTHDTIHAPPPLLSLIVYPTLNFISGLKVQVVQQWYSALYLSARNSKYTYMTLYAMSRFVPISLKGDNCVIWCHVDSCLSMVVHYNGPLKLIGLWMNKWRIAKDKYMYP